MAPTACSDPPLCTCLRLVLFVVFSLSLPLTIDAQSVTYHLHREASSSASLFQLKPANPDSSILAIQSANLKNVANGEYLIKEFDTQSNVPNASGVVSSGSAVSFTLWLKKTASAGTMFPRVKLKLNTTNGTSICVLTGSNPLTTTLSSYTLTGTVPSNVSRAPPTVFTYGLGSA